MNLHKKIIVISEKRKYNVPSVQLADRGNF